MSLSSKHQRIDDLMDKASEALSQTAYFQAERMAHKALLMAFDTGDFERMARITMPLREARRLRLQLALDVGRITILEEQPITEEMKIESGCYLVQPPCVGADSRRVRMAALQQEIPVAIICREPLTMLRLCPIVATMPGKSYRAKIDPPDDPAAPDMAWFTMALEAIGDAAIESIDLEKPAPRRVENLLECLDAVGEHERLHQALEETCRQAMVETADSTESKASLA